MEERKRCAALLIQASKAFKRFIPDRPFYDLEHTDIIYKNMESLRLNHGHILRLLKEFYKVSIESKFNITLGLDLLQADIENLRNSLLVIDRPSSNNTNQELYRLLKDLNLLQYWQVLTNYYGVTSIKSLNTCIFKIPSVKDHIDPKSLDLLKHHLYQADILKSVSSNTNKTTFQFKSSVIRSRELFLKAATQLTEFILEKQKIKVNQNSIFKPTITGRKSGFVISFIPSKRVEYDLLFRASEHNFQAIKFHQLCDSKGPTLTIAIGECRKRMPYLLAGYNCEDWTSSSTWFLNRKGFLASFSITTGQVETKLDRNPEIAQGCYHRVTYGPLFGSSPNFYISNSCNVNFDSKVALTLGGSYTNQISEEENDIESIDLKIKDYEIFSIK